MTTPSILLIEPHTETRTTLAETLKQSFTVLACASPKEAQKKLAKASVSLIITETNFSQEAIWVSVYRKSKEC